MRALGPRWGPGRPFHLLVKDQARRCRGRGTPGAEQQEQRPGWNLLDRAEGSEGARSTNQSQAGREKLPGAQGWACRREVSRAGSGPAASTPAQDRLSHPPGRGERATRFSAGPRPPPLRALRNKGPRRLLPRGTAPISPAPLANSPATAGPSRDSGSLRHGGRRRRSVLPRGALSVSSQRQELPRHPTSPTQAPGGGPKPPAPLQACPRGPGSRALESCSSGKVPAPGLPRVILSSRPHFTPGDVPRREEGLTTHQPRQSRQRAVGLVHSSHRSPTPTPTTSATPGLARPLQRRLLHLKCPLGDSRAPSQADLLPGRKEITGFPVRPWRSTWSPLHTPNQKGARGSAWASSPGPEERGTAHPAKTLRTGLGSERGGAARRAAPPDSRLGG